MRMRGSLSLALCAAAICSTALAQNNHVPAFKAVPELPYKLVPNFFELPNGTNFGEASAVAVNSKGHIFVFQRVKPMLVEYDAHGKFLRSLAEGVFEKPHGLRIDAQDNIWTTDVAAQVVLKLSPEGRVLMVLGRKDDAAEGDWLFNRPADVAFDADGNIYVADGYGNSRIVKFDKDGRYLKEWGTFGKEPGQFDLPHNIVIDKQGRVYVADRENQRIQIFDTDGKFLDQWTEIGYPFGLAITPDQKILMADGGYDRVIELDLNGKILGAIGEPGRAPGQFSCAHTVAVAPDGHFFVADTFNWRFSVYAPTAASGKMVSYIPTKRVFNAEKPSTGWITRGGK
jgi:DNA-binding beta-propeller fold protein YncE